MVYLFIHQNFPGQYGRLLRLLARQGHRLYFVTQPRNEQQIGGVTRINYTPGGRRAIHCHPLTLDLDEKIRTGAAVVDACKKLRDDGVRPDLIVGHCGWGEMLFVKDVFPDAPVLSYFEFYYHAHGTDLNFDPEFNSVFIGPERLRARNAVTLMSFDATDWGNAPTQWQRSLLPPELRSRVTVLHEGIDTRRLRPREDASFVVPGKRLKLTRRHEVITYISRNLEPYRGFHSFMRAVPEIQRRRPKAQVVVVGGDDVSYGAPAPPGTTYRKMLLEEIGGKLDPRRIHFIDHLRHPDYLRLLQVSSAHVYLTYPFVLSWSFLEAMACGCAIVGSSTPPVMEVLEDRRNGLAVDFFAPREIAARVDEILQHPDRMQGMREAARRTAVERFDLTRQTWPRWQNLFDDLINGRRPALDP